MFNSSFSSHLNSAAFHRERRKYLITALEEMISILSDQPGLLGPKVSLTGINIDS